MGTIDETVAKNREKTSLGQLYEDLITRGLIDPERLPLEVYTDMVAKLCYCNSVRSRLVRLKDSLHAALEETQCLVHCLELLSDGKKSEAYDVYQRNYGRLLWMIGQFEQVSHRSVATQQLDAMVAPLRAELTKLYKEDATLDANRVMPPETNTR